MGVPKFNNLQAECNAHGIAYATDEPLIAYLSASGPAVAVKSLWASMAEYQKHEIYCSEWTNGIAFGGLPELLHRYTPLPGTNQTHLLAAPRNLTYLLAIHPQGALYVDPFDPEHVAQRDALLATLIPHLQLNMVRWLNPNTPLPVIDEWAVPLWHAALAEGGLLPLEAYGDCLAAWQLVADFDWVELGQDLLHCQDIEFPTHDSI